MRLLRALVLVVNGTVLGAGVFLIVYEVEPVERILYSALLALFLFVGVWIYRELGRTIAIDRDCGDCR